MSELQHNKENSASHGHVAGKQKYIFVIFSNNCDQVSTN